MGKGGSTRVPEGEADKGNWWGNLHIMEGNI